MWFVTHKVSSEELEKLCTEYKLSEYLTSVNQPLVEFRE